MKKNFLFLLMFQILFFNNSNASFTNQNYGKHIIKNHNFTTKLEKLFKTKKMTLNIHKISKMIKKNFKASAPVLLNVMKSNNFSDNARWVATILFAKTFGKHAIPVLKKYTTHPNWVLRLSSLRALFSLKSKNVLKKVLKKRLFDKSFLVRDFALDIVRIFKFKKMSPFVWPMLLKKNNYTNKNGAMIKKIILTLGDLKYSKKVKVFIKMFQSKKYSGLYKELDYTLTKITGKISPRLSVSAKQKFWKTLKL